MIKADFCFSLRIFGLALPPTASEAAALQLEAPTRFAGQVLPPVGLNLQVQAKYIPKF